jgi:hypothetical protein
MPGQWRRLLGIHPRSSPPAWDRRWRGSLTTEAKWTCPPGDGGLRRVDAGAPVLPAGQHSHRLSSLDLSGAHADRYCRENLLDRSRKGHGNEILRGIEIILARIVNDPDESCTLCRQVRENRIELQELEVLAGPDSGCRPRNGVWLRCSWRGSVAWVRYGRAYFIVDGRKPSTPGRQG